MGISLRADNAGEQRRPGLRFPILRDQMSQRPAGLPARPASAGGHVQREAAEQPGTRVAGAGAGRSGHPHAEAAGSLPGRGVPTSTEVPRVAPLRLPTAPASHRAQGRCSRKPLPF